MEYEVPTIEVLDVDETAATCCDEHKDCGVSWMSGKFLEHIEAPATCLS